MALKVNYKHEGYNDCSPWPLLYTSVNNPTNYLFVEHVSLFKHVFFSVHISA